MLVPSAADAKPLPAPSPPTMLPQFVLSSFRGVYALLFPDGAPDYQHPEEGEAEYERINVLVRPSRQGEGRRTLAGTVDMRRCSPRIRLDLGAFDSGGGSDVSLSVAAPGEADGLGDGEGSDGRESVFARVTRVAEAEGGDVVVATAGGFWRRGSEGLSLSGREYLAPLSYSRIASDSIVLFSPSVGPHPVCGRAWGRHVCAGSRRFTRVRR